MQSRVTMAASCSSLQPLVPLGRMGSKGWSEEQLAAIVTRDCMIGTALPQVPAKRKTAA